MKPLHCSRWSRGARIAPALALLLGAAGASACGSSDSNANDTNDPQNGTDQPPTETTQGSPQSTGQGAGQGSSGSGSDTGTSSGGTGDGGSSTDGAADGSVHVPAGSCGTANPAKGFIASASITASGATRTYALDVPAGYDGTTLYPIVIGFHGDGGDGASYRSSFPIQTHGGASAIFVWPNGTNNNNGHSFDQNHDPPANADVALFDALVTAISTKYCADKTRVYAHGMSGGAYFTNQLGRWRSSALRAIAPQSGGGPFGNQDSDFSGGNVTVTGAVAAFMVHGDADTTVNLSEGQKSLAYWRLADKSTAGQTATSPSPCEKQNGGTKPVVFCTIPGMNHAIWSGAPAAIWSFFAAN
jgi:polyhydroxybutyrate depolymerase